MNAIVKNILMTTFILSIFRESCESYNLNHIISAKYDNRTDVVRLRRQSPVLSCKGDVLKFQCATTTDCISAELECDGREDCPDGSDEKESLCKDFPKKCKTPAKPSHGQWINLNNNKSDYFSSHIDANNVIKYSCHPGYKLSTTVEASLLVHCLPYGEWSLTVLPVCQKLCPSIYNSPLITASCKNEGSSVRCDKATDNTIVTYKCAPHYEAPYGRPKSSTCYDGFWDYIPKCIPVCGEKRVSATPLIVNGHEVERGHYPWAVALYSSKNSDPYFTNVCGGSLLSTDVVLTAAHCVSQKETGKTYDAKYYRVGAGKFYNLYEDPRDADTAQYAEVDLIEAYREYKGQIQNFRGDIALLKLKTNLVLSEVVQPVCYHNIPIIEPNTVGLVTGWGYTSSSGEPSETLKELELPYNADEQCLKDLDKDFSDRYFTFDKLCAGFNDQNTSVCNGDSGGGLVFRNPSFKRRYFIHGIVSLAHTFRENQKIHCNIQRNALFTKVENYVEWIQLKVRHWTRTTNNNAKKCRAPAQPEHGRWVYLNNGSKIEPNQEIDVNTAITFSCNQSYQLSDTNDDSLAMLCMPTGKWNVTVMPLCQKLCPAMYNGPGITVSCNKNGSSIPCDKATDNTVVVYKCAPYYEPADRRGWNGLCYNGFWHYNPSCEPVCGVKSVPEKSFLIGEHDAVNGSHPWLVSLYSNKNSDREFTHICSGNLITSGIILTAASCVAMPETGEIIPAKHFRVKAGRYYTQYRDTRDGVNAQYSEVAEIETPKEYKGQIFGDIALLKLKTSLILSKDVQPVCYKNLHAVLPALSANISGEVTGRRYSTSSAFGKQSETLRELEVFYSIYEQNECVVNLDKDFANKYLFSDKMCVGFKEKETDVCRGDRGEGLVLQDYKRNQTLYYIFGVTGLGHSYIRNGTNCNIQRATLFTNVLNYLEWIQFKVQEWTTGKIENTSGNDTRTTALQTTSPVPPSGCATAIKSCCSAENPNVIPFNCLEWRGCPGPFWDVSPCQLASAMPAS